MLHQSFCSECGGITKIVRLGTDRRISRIDDIEIPPNLWINHGIAIDAHCVCPTLQTQVVSITEQVKRKLKSAERLRPAQVQHALPQRTVNFLGELVEILAKKGLLGDEELTSLGLKRS